jgi:hypothetical protein
MKRAALTHPKMYDLAAGLGCSHPEAIGYVNLLLDFAAVNSPRGDVGKFSDGAIARGCMWQGDPKEFIRALIAARWLDADSTYRLLVHDFEENSEQWVKLKLIKSGLTFAKPTALPIAEATAEASAVDTAEVSAPRASSLLSSSLYPISNAAAATAANGHSRKSGKKKFAKPTLEEVAAYCGERGNAVDPSRFIDYYETVGWLVGKNRSPMKDWKAAVRTWEQNHSNSAGSNGQSPGDRLAAMVKT